MGDGGYFLSTTEITKLAFVALGEKYYLNQDLNLQPFI